MSISVYVGKDSQGKSWTPDHAHEIEGLLTLLTNLWRKYQHLQEHYCVLANIKSPDADVIIFSERGVGVIELKHHPGNIRIDSRGQWTANNKPIKGGSHKNPHAQVQAYSQRLRDKLLPFILPKNWANDRQKWNQVKTQTAVCFTNPSANLDNIGSGRDSWNSPRERESWEDSFDIIRPTDVGHWAFKLRLGISKSHDNNFEPIRIDPETQIKCAEVILGGKQWTDIESFMPTNQPYAYLYMSLADSADSIFNLDKDRITIGRSMDCDIVVPRQFKRVSSKHCEIIRLPGVISLSNMGAKNGTFVDGKPISKPQTLSGGEIITLGNIIANDKSCQLRLQLRNNVVSQLSQTEVSDKL